MTGPEISNDLLARWEQLAIEAGSLPTQAPAWASAVAAVQDGELETILAEGDELSGLAPMIHLGPTLELAGSRTLGEPGDLLTRTPEALSELCENLLERERAIVLDRIPAGSPTIEALAAATGERARLRLSHRPGHPFIELDERWAEPGGGLSSSRRSSLRRGRRKAEKLGEVEIERLDPAPSEVEGLLDEAFLIESRSWKSELGTAILSNPGDEAFFRRYALELAERGQLRLEFLRIDGEGVAMQYAALWNRRLWLFKIGYDERFSAASPGQLLLAESIAAATGEGLEGYELLGSRESWTDVWTREVRPCVGCVVYPRGLPGVRAEAAIRGRAAGDRTRRIARRRKRMIVNRASSAYVAGPDLDDALAEARRCAGAGFATTIGFWGGGGDPPGRATAEALASAAEAPADSEVSLKLPDLGGAADLDQILAACRDRGLTLHIDAMGPESAEASQREALRLAAAAPGAVGCTLPGRWARSRDDAAALRDSGLRVRVVKGEHEDSVEAELELRAGFLEIVRTLAGGNCHVEVATHDAKLARASLDALRAGGTEAELQVLYGMPMSGAIKVGRSLGVPIRVYVPYGASRLPFGRRAIQRNPLRAGTLLRDLSPLPPRRPPGA